MPHPTVNSCGGCGIVLAQAIARGLLWWWEDPFERNGANTGDKATWSNYDASSYHLRYGFKSLQGIPKGGGEFSCMHLSHFVVVPCQEMPFSNGPKAKHGSSVDSHATKPHADWLLTAILIFLASFRPV